MLSTSQIEITRINIGFQALLLIRKNDQGSIVLHLSVNLENLLAILDMLLHATCRLQLDVNSKA